MRPRLAWILLLVLVPGAFLAGFRLHRNAATVSDSGGRAVLYWADPMDPSVHSGKPGIAPCGMPFEPVYADERGATAPPGSVSVPPEARQLSGIRVEPAEVRTVTHTLRLAGRITPDAARVFRLYSVTDGWIRQVSPASAGSSVKKDQLLASYYSVEILGPQQAYVSALDAFDRLDRGKPDKADQLELNRKNVDRTKQQLLNLGMSETQIEDLGGMRKATPTIELRSPVSGFVLVRNASMEQRFDRTTELYVVADLERVWILADAFGDDAEHLPPGARAEVRLPGRRETVSAVVSDALPQFDPATKTLHVRLEAANPRFALRPEMFVDVEVPVTLPPALAIPSAAVLDSGREKTVFVDRGEGTFERRPVETGWRAGGFVEIVAGLAAGERVAVSGNFLLDSESRMRLAGAGAGDAAPGSARHD
jgi:membrane fusion protein, copper/silver efflux system